MARRTDVEREQMAFADKKGKNKRGIGGAILRGVAGTGAEKLGNRVSSNMFGTGVGLGDVLGSMIGSIPLKKGGRVKKKFAEGGSPGIDYVARKGGGMKPDMKSFKSQVATAKKKMGKNHYGVGGGLAGAMAGGALKPFLQKIPMVGGLLGSAAPYALGGLGAMLTGPMKRGGHAKGKIMKRAAGGSVYEHQMVGERPSRKPHGFNYESTMVGQKPTRRATKMAAGGVGKIRHKQATAFGMPIKSKHRRDV